MASAMDKRQYRLPLDTTTLSLKVSKKNIRHACFSLTKGNYDTRAEQEKLKKFLQTRKIRKLLVFFLRIFYRLKTLMISTITALRRWIQL